MKRIVTLIIIFFNLLSVKTAQAQHEIELHFMDSVSQSGLTNPAFRLRSGKSTYSLPGVSYNVISPYAGSQLSFDKEGKRTLDFKTVFNIAKPVSHLYGNFEVQAIGLSLGFKKLTVSFHNSIKGNTHLNVSKDLIGGFAYGNRSYLGKTMNLGSGFNATLHSELGLGAAYKINDKITVGARIKRLSGIANIATLKQKVELYTDSVDYKLSFNTDFDVRTYGLKTFENFGNGTYTLGDIFISENGGWSFDLGGTMQWNKLRIDASVIDLASSITWVKDIKTYSSSGKYEYTGSKSDKFFSFESLGEKDIQDTLKKALNVQEGTTAKTTTKLPLKTYLGLTYNITEKIRLGFLMYNESWNGISQTDFAFNTTFTLSKAVQLGATYSARAGNYNNVGVHAVFKLGPVQLYGATDNILAVVDSYKAKSTNGRIGLNIIF